MASPLYNDHLTGDSAQSHGDQGHLPSTLQPTRHPSDSPCTRFSLASTALPDAQIPAQRSTVHFAEPPTQTPRKIQRKTSFLPWTPSRTISQNAGTPRAEQTAAGDTREAKTRSRWWQPNRYATGTNRHRLTISNPIPPPRPPRPDGVHPDHPQSSLPMQIEATNDTSRYRRMSESSPRTPPPIPLRSPARVPPASRTRQLSDFDHDKDDPAFARIDPDGWDKVVPKAWVEDQFSEDSSRESRSVYSQDNGEEEARRRLNARLSSTMASSPFLAGEALPIGMLDETEHSMQTQSQELSSSPKQAQQMRMPFERSRLSSSTGRSVSRWLTSVCPSSDIHKASDAFHMDKTTTSRDSGQSQLLQPGEADVQRQSPTKTLDTLVNSEKHVQSLKSRREGTWSPYVHPLLAPRSLNFRKPATTSAPPAGPITGDASVSGRIQEIATNYAGPPTTPVNPIFDRNTNDTKTDPLKHTSTTAPLSPTSQVSRKSDTNKPLPLPPDESAESKAADARNLQTISDLNDSIDEIIDLYLCRDEDQGPPQSGPTPQQKREEARTQVASSPTTTTATTIINTTSTPVVGNMRQQTGPDVLHDVPSQQVPLQGTSTSSSFVPRRPPPPPPPPFVPDSSEVPRPTQSPSNPHFTASFPVFYDANSYPELGHGRSEDERQVRKRRSLRAVETHVYGEGGTWI